MRASIQSLISRIEQTKRVADSFELPRQAAAHSMWMVRHEVLCDEARRMLGFVQEDLDEVMAERKEEIEALEAAVKEDK